MFIAVTFMCLVSGDCRFIYDHMATSEANCLERNKMLAQTLEANDNVMAYQNTCIPIPKETHARS